jgi:hypothetical protein
LTGILLLRSGLRIAEPASSAASIIRGPAGLAAPAAVSHDGGRLQVAHRATMPQSPPPSGKVSRRRR